MPAADVVVQLDVIEHADGVCYVSCASPYGETTQRMQLPTQGTDLLLRLSQVEANVLRSGAQIVTRGAAGRLEAPVRELGEELCDAVLQDEARMLFEESLRQARRDNAPFRLLLKIRGPTVSQLPWEFLYDRRRGDYLALNVPVVRYLEVMQPVAPVTVTLPLAGRLHIRPEGAGERAPSLPQAAIIGLFMWGGYLLVLLALYIAPLSVVAPVRETAVVAVAVWGVWKLRERRAAALKIAGASATLIGVSLLAL